MYELIPDKYELSPGTTITVRCSSNLLELVGQKTFTCLDSGKWSYQTKPYCTDQPVSQPTEQSLDDATKIIIGVVSGVAALIVIALLIMIIAIWYRDRHRKNERKRLIEMWERDNKSAYGRATSGPSTMGTGMYGRYPSQRPVALPPPYDYRDRDYRETDRRSRLSHPYFYPDYRSDSGHYDIKRGRRARSQDDLDYMDNKMYDRRLNRRNSSFESDEYLDRSGMHGDRYAGRDPYLWRNAYI